MGPVRPAANGNRDMEFRVPRNYFMDTEFNSRSSSYKPSPDRRSSSSRNISTTKPKPVKSQSSKSTRVVTSIRSAFVSTPVPSTLTSSIPSTLTSSIPSTLTSSIPSTLTSSVPSTFTGSAPSTLSNSVLSESSSVISSGLSSPMSSSFSSSGESSRSYASSSTYMSTWDYGTGAYISRATRDGSTSPQSQCSTLDLNNSSGENDFSEV